MTQYSQASWSALVTVTLCMAYFPESLHAVDCSLSDSRYTVSPGSSFNITVAGSTASEIETAVDYWSSCLGYGTSFPFFQTGGAGGVPVIIRKIVGNSTTPGGGCGRIDPVIVNGHLENAAITVWTNQSNGVSCEPLTDSIAHELGHLLGLDDAPIDGSCFGHIMGNRAPGGTRSVQSDDCAIADEQWETASESAPPPDPYCEVFCWTDCVNGSCPPRPPGMGCPILMDLENDGIRLTGLDDPVWFDIDADGALDLMSWTNRSEGILALDRNGNGAIDDGGELFGNHTLLADGTKALNGYLALAELDAWIFGGNADGEIDSADAAFSSLRMWVDRNHDGTSQPAELYSLAETGIRRLALSYRRSNRTDRHGNEFRFRSWAWKAGRNGGERPMLTWDVFFLVVP